MEGLKEGEAKELLKKFGPNLLPEAKTDSLLIIFFRQFQSPLIYLLLVAALIVFALGKEIDGSVILFVLLFNATVGTIQEGKAQNTLAALKKFVETYAVVWRERKEKIVPAKDIVPGDILILSEGEKIAADGRIISANNLKIDESPLTGESVPVHKSETGPQNTIFMGTYVVGGSGRVLVEKTGILTAIGKIAKEVSRIDTEIPLKREFRAFSRLIIGAVLGLSLLLFLVGLARGLEAQTMFTTVVSLVVSVIPEGLPIVVTLVLVTGVWRMAKKNALVKKLPAIEALGQAKVVALDKTGTVTKNEMVVRKVFSEGKIFAVEGSGYDPSGKILGKGQHLLLLGQVAGLSASASIAPKEEGGFRVGGDPTEAALLTFAHKLGLEKDELEIAFPKIEEKPFDYKTKLHLTFHRGPKGEKLVVATGAPEAILRFCQVSVKEKKKLEKIFSSLSQQGLRVVAAAFGKPQKPDFVGFYGIEDSVRDEAKVAIKRGQEAGIKIIMVTGDHKITAQAIAKEAGIYQSGDLILTGEELELLSDEELSQKLPQISVFARVTPKDKVRIIEAYRKQKLIIGMTGDGVNDAPALVAADLGIGMGKIGTEVAREAADIVLLDDNLESLVLAVEEGRNIYRTLKKVILYLFSTGLGEVLTISFALFLGWPLPLLAAQIIWLNLITDGFLDVALAMEPKEKGLLKGEFKRGKFLIDSMMVQRMVVMALPMVLGTLFLFRNSLNGDLTKAWTVSLTTLAVFQWFNAWNCRSEKESIFRLNPFANKFLVGATIIVIGLQFLALHNPFFQEVLRTTPLSFREWLGIILVATTILLFEELRKLLYRWKHA